MAGLVVAALALMGDNSDDWSALAEACAATAEALPLPPDEGADLLAGLVALDEELEDEGSDPDGDFARVVIGASTYRSGAISPETFGQALRRFRATCEVAGHSFDGAAAPTTQVVSSVPTTKAPSTTDAPTTTEAEVTEVDGCPAPPSESPTPEVAAQCLYNAYRAGDRDVATFYASEEAIDAMFETPWEPPEWSFLGCEATDTVQPVCSYFIEDDLHGVGVEMLMSYGASVGAAVMEVNFYG